ncbi:MAG: hypothetical protein HYY96_05570 [Candidatus Tectomicrobia bacterium]|nr:hypothetical protein [Candidatus Tectomicrobia bacterium]
MLNWLITPAEASSHLVVRTSLLLRGGAPLWLAALLGLLALALVVYAWPSLRRRVHRPLALALSAMRLLALLSILFFLLNPTLLRQTFQRMRPRLPVLIDVSRSMEINDGTEGRTRLQDVQHFLQDPSLRFFEELAQDFVVEPLQFHEEVEPLPNEGLGQLGVRGKRTNILGALASVDRPRVGSEPSPRDTAATSGREVAGVAADAPLAGIVVISDGAHNAGVMNEALLRAVRAPVAAIGVGDAASFRDIRLADLKAPGFGFLHHPLSIEAEIVVDGFSGLNLPVVLKQEGTVLQTKVVIPQAGKRSTAVSFSYTPTSLGERHYSLSIPVQSGERIKANNTVTFKINVVRDKIRVLLVTGTPSWNYRFLRRTLRGDPTIDLISFVILRTPFDQVNVPQDELSLIPFPTDRLFTEELQNFDIIIFDNFSYRFYFPLQYLENVRKYVEEGGAFVMFGGDRSFSAGGYAGTPVDDLLPVTLEQVGSSYEEQPFRMELTEAGRLHPITRLVDDEEENVSIWRQMPKLEGYNLALRTKPNATLLGVQPGKANQYGQLPIFAVTKYGKGRSLALLSDFFWRWNFQMIGEQKSNRPYLKLIRQMIRWLINEPQFRQVRLFAAKDAYEPGEEANLKAYVMRDDGGPAANAVLEVGVTDPSGREIRAPYSSSERPGEFNVPLKLAEFGFYRVRARAMVDGKEVGENSLVVAAQTPDWELRDAAMNEALLQRLARQTGGMYRPLKSFDRGALRELRQALRTQFQPKIVEESRWRLWHNVVTLLGLVLLLGSEWYIRRRNSLL